MTNKALTSLRAAGIFFCFLPEGILCNTVDKALDGDLWLTGDPLLGVHWLSRMQRMNILLSCHRCLNIGSDSWDFFLDTADIFILITVFQQ